MSVFWLSESLPVSATAEENIPEPRPTTFPQDLLTEFSFWDSEKGNFIRPTMEQHRELYERLLSIYPNLSAINIIFPWIVIQMEDDIPPPLQRPFLIAGFMAVFLLDGEPFPLGVMDLGTPAQGILENIPPTIKADLKPYHKPSIQTIEYIFNVIEDAEHVSIYPRQLLIELRQMDDETFHQLLKGLPRAFGLLPTGYTNGAFIHTYASQMKTPNP